MTDHINDPAQQARDPDGYLVEREGDVTFPRLVRTRAEADAWIRAADLSPRITVRDLYAAQPPAARTEEELVEQAHAFAAKLSGKPQADGEKAAKDYEHGYNDGVEWAQTHGARSSAGNVDADLADRCRELLEWSATGLLNKGEGGALRAYAERLKEKVGGHYALTVAENNTKNEAMREIVRLANEPQGARMSSDDVVRAAAGGVTSALEAMTSGAKKTFQEPPMVLSRPNEPQEAWQPSSEQIDAAAQYLVHTVERKLWGGIREDGRARDGGFEPFHSAQFSYAINSNARQEDYRDVIREIASLLSRPQHSTGEA